MLKRYQACIDLQKNALVIQGREIRFLSEHELPKNALEEELEVDEWVSRPTYRVSRPISLSPFL